MRLLDREIIIEDYKIEPSKKIEGDMCLHLQIKFNNVPHVVFTSSKGLMEMIKQVSRDDFPIEATIIEVNKQYQFATE